MMKIKTFFILATCFNIFFGCSNKIKDSVSEKSSNEIIEIQKKLQKQEELLQRLQGLIADQIILNNDLEQSIPPRELLDSLQKISIELQNRSENIEKKLSSLNNDIKKIEITKEAPKVPKTEFSFQKDKIILGLISIHAGNTDNAKEHFKEIINDRKKTKLKGEVLMAIGHSFLSQGHGKQAASHYGIFIREYPKSPHIPQALYFLGKTMEILGEFEKQKILWSDLIEKFPKSNYSKRAKKILFKKVESKK